LAAAKSRFLNGPPSLSGMLEWQRAQFSANTVCHGVTAPLPNSCSRSDEIGAAVARGRTRRLAGPGAGGVRGRSGPIRRRRRNRAVLQAILDGPEVRAITPALADVERRLAKAALLRVDLAHVGEVIDPALLGARADVEIDALDRFVRADRILAALEDVVHAGQHDFLAAEVDDRRVVLTRALLPALAVAARLAPALVLVLLGAAGVGLAPLGDHFALEYGPLGHIDQGVDRARVVDLVVRDRRGVGDARPGVGKHLVFEAADRHPRPQQLGHAGVLVADQALDVLPLRMRRVGRRVERIEGDVARATGGADQEGRLDRGVGQLAHPLIRFDAGGRGQRAAVAGPVGRAAVELRPLGGVEARIGKLADAQRTGRGAELEVAGRVSLVGLATLAMRIVGVERRILQAAGGIDVARSCRRT
jgi:hypothetical protein